MPVEIAVGPPLLSINHGATFMVTDLGGEIQADTEQGVFADDTRFVSYYAIFANGLPWQRLNAAATADSAARIYLTSAVVPTEDGDVPAGTLSLVICRTVADGIHEDLDVANHGLVPVRFNLEIALRSDFADLFEVKLGHLVRRGRSVTRWHDRRAELETSYTNRDFRRSLVYHLLNTSSPPGYANGRVTFEVELRPGATWHTCCHYLLAGGETVRAPQRACYHDNAATGHDQLRDPWLDVATKVTSANEDVYRLYRQSVEDMGALRLYDHDSGADLWVPAAGVQEYRTRSPQGYENMGWKDAVDAVVYPDGRQVRQPKALCELQGYVFDAWMRMAEVFDALGDQERASGLRAKARALRAAFEAKFWCGDLGFYAFALDPEKQPVRAIASNAGHCLWSGIATPDRAARVVKRFFEPDLWSGWGIRTLSARNPAYNPFSYQRGSVWPHDNGIIALGFKRYGFAAEAARVARDISEAASYFVSYRLPELYAGIERRPGTFPVQYLGANVPQAWAAGSAFHLIQAILGLRADAPRGRLYVDPELPRWLPEITLHGLAVGPARLDLRCWRDGDCSRWTASIREGAISVHQEAWRPWET